MKKSIKTVVNTDFTKFALMAIASGVMFSSPLCGEIKEDLLAANDDYRSSPRNRRFQQVADNGTNQNQNNPYQNQNSNNPYMDQNSNTPNQNPNNDPNQLPGNLNQTPGKVASSGGCKGNGKCRGTNYNYDNQDTNNPAGRSVAENDNMDTLNRNNRNNKNMLDKNSQKDTINNYNDTDKNNNDYMDEDYNSKAPNGSNKSTALADCKASSGCKGKSRNDQSYQQNYNNNLRQNRLSM